MFAAPGIDPLGVETRFAALPRASSRREFHSRRTRSRAVVAREAPVRLRRGSKPGETVFAPQGSEFALGERRSLLGEGGLLPGERGFAVPTTWSLRAATP
jgi:hypothetical protein